MKITGTLDLFLDLRHDAQWFLTASGQGDLKTFTTLDGTMLTPYPAQLDAWGYPGQYGGLNVRPGWVFNTVPAASGWTYTVEGPDGLQSNQPQDDPVKGFDYFSVVNVPEFIDPSSIGTALADGFGGITREFEFNSTQDRTILYPPVYLFAYPANCWTLEKSSDPVSGSQVESGQTITYTVTARNLTQDGVVPGLGVPLGTAVSDVVIEDDLSGVLVHAPDGVTNLTPSTGTASVTDTTLTWNLGTLAAGATQTLSYQVKVGDDPGAYLENFVYGKSPTDPPTTCFDPAPDERSVPCTTNHHTLFEVSVAKVDDGTPVLPVAGVEFQLWRDSDDDGELCVDVGKPSYPGAASPCVLDELVGTRSTDGDGSIVWRSLAAGRYWVVETGAPVGHETLSWPDNVTDAGRLGWSEDDQVTHVQSSLRVVNHRLPGSVSWQKVDGGDPSVNLGGSQWLLEGPNSQSIPVVDCVATLAADCENGPDTDHREGHFTVSLGINWGDWTLTETVSPAGFRLLDAPEDFTIAAGDLHLDLGALENDRQNVPPLPLTGGTAALLFYGLGAGGLAAGLASAVWAQHRRRLQPAMPQGPLGAGESRQHP